MSKTIEEKIENCCKSNGVGIMSGTFLLNQLYPIREGLKVFREMGGPENWDEIMEMMEILEKSEGKWDTKWYEYPDNN